MSNINNKEDNVSKEKWEEIKIKVIQNQILSSLYVKNNPNEEDSILNKKILDLYKKINGNDSSINNEPTQNICFNSPPGAGLEFLQKKITYEISKELGFNFVDNPKADYVPQKNDIVFYSKELEAKITGIPTSLKNVNKQDENKNVNDLLSSDAKKVIVFVSEASSKLISDALSHENKDKAVLTVNNNNNQDVPSLIKTRFSFVNTPENLLIKADSLSKEMGQFLHKLRFTEYKVENSPKNK